MKMCGDRWRCEELGGEEGWKEVEKDGKRW